MISFNGGDQASGGKRRQGEGDQLSYAHAFRAYTFQENIFAEFDRLLMEGKTFDGLVINLLQTGYSVPLDTFVHFHSYAGRLLRPQGVLLFVKGEGAITLMRDDPSGGLSFNVYDSVYGIFARYPLLSDYVCATIPGIERRRMRGGGSTLANHILYTSIPVLTDSGLNYKNSFELPAPENWVIQLIDDYASVEALSKLMEARYRVPVDETLRILQELESEKIIFPIFSRIQFLSNCYHNRKPFRLGTYLVSAGIITASQLEELLETQQQEGWGRGQRTMLGLLAVRSGHINHRELEILLNDQYLYGGYHKAAAGDDAALVNVERMKDAMIGSLGAIDVAGLLQSLSTAKKTGVLTVESRNKAIVLAFASGKPTHALMNKLKGYQAITEFLVGWTEGVFVFRDRGSSPDLDEQCALRQSLDRILLDSALYHDQSREIVSRLPGGPNVLLERVHNFEDLWSGQALSKLEYMDGSPVSRDDCLMIQQLARMVDGWTTLDGIIKSFDLWPSYMIVKAIQLMLDQRYVKIQQASLFRPLTVFQKIGSELERILGPELNKAVLEKSLHDAHGDSRAGKRFQVDSEGVVSVDLACVKTSRLPLSDVLLELRCWMEAYLACCRRETNPGTVNDLIAKVVHGSLR